MVLDFLAVDNFDFTRKIVKKNLGEKLVKMFDGTFGSKSVASGGRSQILQKINCDFCSISRIFFRRNFPYGG